ncbi:hypothetical protein F0U44_07080 [Nocardioides humilatus]|uniref:Uncharacterized protein n=1 Tax=Nocardioides humilatus TaxID=2607660 RepID=A0A5B1LHQ7_9ACTN|nr:hypothetical protein [Nocardioides humilatus]KAA1420183.1 hypothetical protein F0U44_07080 [Nocardioides humilatus]
MKLMKNLTYSNLTSTTALVLALTGVGGAAYAAGLAENSVGSPQIKDSAVKTSELGKDAVNAAKVDNGSLTLADLNAPARKALTADAFYDELEFHNISSGSPDTTIFEFTVPAGDYFVSASANVTNTGDFLNDFTCKITQPIGDLARTVATSEVRVGASGGDLGTISLDGVAVDTEAAITLTMTCDGEVAPYSGKVLDPTIVAVELGTAAQQ